MPDTIGGEDELTITPGDIARIRASRNWSTYKLARHLGCNQSTAWRMEKGLSPINGMAKKLLIPLLSTDGAEG